VLIARAAALGAGMVLPGCGGADVSSGSPFVAESWPEAERPFQSDPKWIGGDSAYSIDLGNGRVLWLFGDSFIANSAARSRSDSVMVHNAIAIQTGYDITTASLKFYLNSSTPPSAFFGAPSSTTWLWPVDGVRIGSRLILFQTQIETSTGGLGFKGVGWGAVAIENPDADPASWTITSLATQAQFGVTLGSAVVVIDGYLYAFSAGLTTPGPTYVARWPVSALSTNSLSNPQWYGGTIGWVTGDQLPHSPAAVASIGQSEFSIFPVTKPSPYLVIQTSGFGAATIAYETAAAVTGPYSGAQTFYSPPERSQANILIYSAKMHPELLAPGYDVVATYCTNSTNFSTLVSDMSLYFPRFIRARWKS
jgi:hypothetical protein